MSQGQAESESLRPEASREQRSRSLLRNYAFSLILLAGIVVGALVGWLRRDWGLAVKPAGEVFLNALYVAVVPVVFFSIASAVAGMAGAGRLARVLGWMMVVFIATGIISSGLMVACVQAYPPAKGVTLPPEKPVAEEVKTTAELVVGALTVPDFWQLLVRKNVLALIVFAVLVGLAARGAGDKGRPFSAFLVSGNEVFLKLVSYIMYYAPVGLAAFFAYTVADLGPRLVAGYLRTVFLYYPVCILYFFIAFTLYAWLAGQGRGVRAFWSNIVPASLTAVGTGSSYATIPSNLLAAERIGVPADIRETVIPIGATIHMDGSCLSAIVKIAFLFGFYHMPFAGSETVAKAIVVALLSGTVMSGIPGGGFAGEVLIVSMYNFPPEALGFIMVIGQLVDPPATATNAIGDNVASMMVARILGGRRWMEARQAA